MAIYKVAVWQASWGGEYATSLEWQDDKDHVRISEFVEIDFPDRETSEVVSEQLSNIDKAIEETKENALKAIEKLQEKKAQLLAITHEAA